MPITRDPEFPAETAQLMQSFNRCADGHDMISVIEASGNMFSSALHNYGAAAKMSEDEMIRFARAMCDNVLENVKMNWNRQESPTDIEVKIN